MHRLHLLRHAKSSCGRRRRRPRAPAQPARPRGGAPDRRRPSRRRSGRSIWCCARPRCAPARRRHWCWPGSTRRRASCSRTGSTWPARRRCCGACAGSTRTDGSGAGDRPQPGAARTGGHPRHAGFAALSRRSPTGKFPTTARASFAIARHWADLDADAPRADRLRDGEIARRRRADRRRLGAGTRRASVIGDRPAGAERQPVEPARPGARRRQRSAPCGGTR